MAPIVALSGMLLYQPDYERCRNSRVAGSCWTSETARLRKAGLAWAVQIRQDFLVGWKRIERRLTDAAMADDPTAKLAEELLFEGDAFIAGPLSHEDAKYWIDHRTDLDESAINSHLYKIRHQIAEQAQAIVGDNLPITDSEKREIIRLALDARQAALEQRRTEEAARRAEAATAALKQQQDKSKSLWDRKDRLATAIHAAIGKRIANISTYWKGSEKRIYLDSGDDKACLYVTGSGNKRPGSIDSAFGKPFKNCDQALIRAALEMCDHDWKTVRMGVDEDGKACEPWMGQGKV